MRWQAWARGVIALAGVACAGAIYFSYRDRKLTPETTAPPVVEGTETSRMAAGEYVRSKDGRETLTIKHARRTTYEDGRMRFEQAAMKSFGEHAVDIWADTVESQAGGAGKENPAVLLLNGHVRLRTKDGLEALMDSATYNDFTRTLTTPGQLTFSRGRMSGEGNRATYQELEDVLTLTDKAHVRVVPDEQGKGALDATSRQLTLRRPAKLVRLDERARIVRDGDILSAQTANLYMNEDESRLTKIELRGQSHVEPGTGKGTTAPPDMKAEDIDLDLHDDGQTIRHAGLTSREAVATVDMASDTGHRVIEGMKIALDLAPDGQTLTRLDADQQVTAKLPKTADTGPRRIEADTLRATGKDQGGLDGATFEGRLVTYVEELLSRSGPGAHTRTVTSRRLELALKGQLDAIDRAKFTNKVELKDPDGSANADIAEYDPDAKRMNLRQASPGPNLPRAMSGDRQVEAREIDLHIDSSDLDARFDVRTRVNPTSKPGDGRAASALFEPGTPITGTAERLNYVGNQATYTGGKSGPARLKQNQRLVTGNVIVFESQANDLTATGSVETVMFADQASGTKSPSPTPSKYVIKHADSLVYKDGARTAVFKGTAVTLQSDDGETTAKSVDLKFAQDSRDIQQMVWTSSVNFKLASGRRGIGDRLQYDAATGRYVLIGAPAQVLLPKADGSAVCGLSSGPTMTFQKEGGDAEGGLESTPNVPCSTPLPYVRK